MKKNESLDTSFYILGWMITAFIAVLAIIFLIFGTEFLNNLSGCRFKEVTGLYCPGCGGTRASFAFFKGHFLQSCFYNPFVPYCGVFCGWFMISQTIERISRHRIKIAMHFRDIYVWVAITILLGNWVVKNIFVLCGTRLLG